MHELVVGDRGIEPRASRTRTVRSTDELAPAMFEETLHKVAPRGVEPPTFPLGRDCSIH